MQFALLDNNLDAAAESYLFRAPLKFITCDDPSEAEDALTQIEAGRAAGYYAVGYASYELAQTFGMAVATKPAGPEVPLLSFGLFARREVLTSDEVDAFLRNHQGPHAPFLADAHWLEPQARYLCDIEKIHDHLLAGDSYQVNHTIRHLSRFGGCPLRFYARLRQAQPVAYGALLAFPQATVLSRSPELFFERRGSTLRTRPMKGTAPRRIGHEEQDRAALRSDPKQASENVMIVDLLRNDMGRIAHKGSVSVDALFSVETYRSVHQMTSSISCQVDPAQNLHQLFGALFPCGSITGAPKKRTCEIIAQTEGTRRGIYCGAIGYMTPTHDMCFSVPIRTYVIGRDRRAVLGVGGGIVHESRAGDEYDECLLKGRFLLGLQPEFNLLECFHYSPQDGPRHMDLHLDRLARSCAALGTDLDRNALETRLAAFLPGVKTMSKIRIEVPFAGAPIIEAVPLGPEAPGPKHVVLAATRVDSRDPVYRHKTTNRALFNDALARARALGAHDAVFANERGELTEASYHSLVLRLGGDYLTPALECGLLDGVGRRLFLHQNPVRETILPVGMLYEADEVLLVSSIRGALPVKVL